MCTGVAERLCVSRCGVCRAANPRRRRYTPPHLNTGSLHPTDRHPRYYAALRVRQGPARLSPALMFPNVTYGRPGCRGDFVDDVCRCISHSEHEVDSPFTPMLEENTSMLAPSTAASTFSHTGSFVSPLRRHSVPGSHIIQVPASPRAGNPWVKNREAGKGDKIESVRSEELCHKISPWALAYIISISVSTTSRPLEPTLITPFCSTTFVSGRGTHPSVTTNESVLATLATLILLLVLFPALVWRTCK